MAVFRAFKPEAMNKIAKSMGYTGNMAQFQDFIEQDPARKARMQQFTNAAIQMARGGMVRMQQGGTIASQANYGTAVGPVNNRAPLNIASVSTADYVFRDSQGNAASDPSQIDYSKSGPSYTMSEPSDDYPRVYGVPGERLTNPRNFITDTTTCCADRSTSKCNTGIYPTYVSAGSTCWWCYASSTYS